MGAVGGTWGIFGVGESLGRHGCERVRQETFIGLDQLCNWLGVLATDGRGCHVLEEATQSFTAVQPGEDVQK
ncbi:hypothetical protein PBY51_002385 [Eleginops maclovinus]|uniref:Uncharacterized protein n=1 Tax=Eleginops maclovinus TaxID=56733 RepID=A0AAN7X897_ELEMC|nr:hypothetical protein PBY51_002385 [Eleginops maclovinus]